MENKETRIDSALAISCNDTFWIASARWSQRPRLVAHHPHVCDTDSGYIMILPGQTRLQHIVYTNAPKLTPEIKTEQHCQRCWKNVVCRASFLLILVYARKSLSRRNESERYPQNTIMPRRSPKELFRLVDHSCQRWKIL